MTERGEIHIASKFVAPPSPERSFLGLESPILLGNIPLCYGIAIAIFCIEK